MGIQPCLGMSVSKQMYVDYVISDLRKREEMGTHTIIFDLSTLVSDMIKKSKFKSRATTDLVVKL
jgi:hypothetical protein